MFKPPVSFLKMLPWKRINVNQSGMPAMLSTAASEKRKAKAVIFDMGGVMLPSPLRVFKGSFMQ